MSLLVLSVAELNSTKSLGPVLVTPLNLDLGRWMWWPSKLAHKPDPAPAELSHERAAALTAR